MRPLPLRLRMIQNCPGELKYDILIGLVHHEGAPEPNWFILSTEFGYQTFGNKRLKIQPFMRKNHEELLNYFPHLKPFVDLHLSNDQGVPPGAAVNGWYHAGGIHWHRGDAKVLADHLRIPLETAISLRDAVLGKQITQNEFNEFVDEQRPRWRRESNHARRILENPVFGPDGSLIVPPIEEMPSAENSAPPVALPKGPGL